MQQPFLFEENRVREHKKRSGDPGLRTQILQALRENHDRSANGRRRGGNCMQSGKLQYGYQLAHDGSELGSQEIPEIQHFLHWGR